MLDCFFCFKFSVDKFWDCGNVFNTCFFFFIKNPMEEIFDDGLMPESFEEIARAYSNSLKSKKFVFVNLEKEEFNLLLSEILVLFSKMQACLKRLVGFVECGHLENVVSNSISTLCQKFKKKMPRKFKCVTNENSAFLCLVGLENSLILKLMLLSFKSGEIELCQEIVASITGVFSESLNIECFCLAD